MKVFVPPSFARRAAKERLTDNALREAVSRADRGLIDAELGLALIKQRIARPGQGRRGGLRSVIVYQRGDLAVFLHLFAKNAKANLTPAETEAYRDFAGVLARLSDADLVRLASERGWKRIDDEQPEEDVPK